MKKLALVLLLLVAGVAHGAMFDNFQDGDYTNNPTWTVQSGGAWSVDGSTEKYLKMPNTAGSQIRLDFDQAYTNELIIVEYDLSILTWNSPTNYNHFSVAVFDTATSTGVDMWCTPNLAYGAPSSGFAITSGYGGSPILGGTGGAFVRGGDDPTPGEYNFDGWEHYKIIIDPLNNNFKMYQDGLLVVNYGTSVNTFDALEFKQLGNAITWSFDNVSVVPEPATICLIGLGSLVTVLRRRR